ncbi:hypothetical protein [Facilibium subflavum]|uniref:hypothetical protein n=1 Tax=Facilibium subflavum TaxID=2219058 RepID=UPI000E651C86|nr:hypothetical protein [Facilibium subflavum]
MGYIKKKPLIVFCSSLLCLGLTHAQQVQDSTKKAVDALVKPLLQKNAESVSQEKGNQKLPAQKEKLSVSTISSSDDSAAAENNTESAKKFALGEVSVNLPDGSVTASMQTPSFSAMIDLSLSFNSGLYQSQKATDENSSAFGLPFGLYIKGLPYVHKVSNEGKNYLLLFWGGSDYYVDSDYESEINCDSQGNNCTGTYHSGLKYQTSKLYQFKTQHGNILIHREDGMIDSFEYAYVLTYANGATYYFDENGLCTIITDRFFQNDTTNNSKHIIQIDYVYDNEGPMDNLIESVTDADGTQLHFQNTSNYVKEIDYPKNPSGDGERFYFHINNGVLEDISTRLDDQYDLGYAFTYNTQGLLSRVDQVLYDRATFNEVRHYVDNEFSYKDVNNSYKVSSVDKLIYGGDGSQVGHDQQSYNYFVMATPQYQFGYDLALDGASRYDYNHATTEVDECIGINCDIKTAHYYNYYGLELMAQISENIDGINYRKISDTYNQYSGVDDSDPYEDSKLSPNYNQPVFSVTVGYNNDGKAISIQKSQSAYNDYGSPVLQESYPAVAYTQATQTLKATPKDKAKYKPMVDGVASSQSIIIPDYPSGIDPQSKTTYQYDNRYQEVILEDSLDCGVGVNKTDCSKALETIKTSVLTTDGKQVYQDKTAMKNLATGESADMPVISYYYGSDTAPCQTGDNYYNAALVCKKVASDDSGKSVTKTYGYTRNDTSGYFPELVTTTMRAYNDPTGVTTTAEVAGSMQESQGKTVTKKTAGYTTETVSTFASLNSVGVLGTNNLSKVTQYNVYGLPLLQKDKEGKTLTYSYDFKNMIVAKYLSPTDAVNGDNSDPILQSRSQYDGEHNLLKKFDQVGIDANGNPQYIITQTNYYDYKEGKALLKKQQDAFGNYTHYEYDSRLRPILKEVYQVKDSQ